MYALCKTGPSAGIDCVQVDTPRPGQGEVLLKVEAAAICGTDLRLYCWDDLARELVRQFPFIPGHEGCGTVVDLGPGVDGLQLGDRVAIETHVSCGRCWYCRHGQAHVCADMALYGHTRNGCFAEFCTVPERAAFPVSPELDSELGAIMEPMGVSLRGVQAAQPRTDSVAIVGAGPIGLFATAIASRMQPTALLAIEPSASRRELALAVGATAVLDPAADDLAGAILAQTEGVGVGSVIECSGSTDALLGSLRYLRTGGRIVMIGNPKQDLRIDGFHDIVHKELNLVGIWGRKLFETWEEVQHLLLDEPELFRSIITDRFPLSDGEEAHERALSGEGAKILLSIAL